MFRSPPHRLLRPPAAPGLRRPAVKPSFSGCRRTAPAWLQVSSFPPGAVSSSQPFQPCPPTRQPSPRPPAQLPRPGAPFSSSPPQSSLFKPTHPERAAGGGPPHPHPALLIQRLPHSSGIIRRSAATGRLPRRQHCLLSTPATRSASPAGWTLGVGEGEHHARQCQSSFGVRASCSPEAKEAAEGAAERRLSPVVFP